MADGRREPRYRRRQLPVPTPTAAEPPSPEIRRLLAWIDASLNHVSGPLAPLLDEQGDQELDEQGQPIFYNPDVIAEFESALLREQAQLAGRLSAAERLLPPETPGELRAVFALPGESLFHALLGWWDVDLEWHSGLAGLTEREAEVVTLSIGMDLPRTPAEEAQQAWEIREAMERHRGTKGMPLALKTVENYLASARNKLRQLITQVTT